jgi:hypothetical protein
MSSPPSQPPAPSYPGLGPSDADMTRYEDIVIDNESKTTQLETVWDQLNININILISKYSQLVKQLASVDQQLTQLNSDDPADDDQIRNLRNDKLDLLGRIQELIGYINRIQPNNQKLDRIIQSLTATNDAIETLSLDNGQGPASVGGYRYKTPKSRGKKMKSKTKSKSYSKSKKTKKSRRKSRRKSQRKSKY